MLDHVGSAREIGREFEIVESFVVGQGSQGPSLCGRVVVLLDDLPKMDCLSVVTF